MDKSAPVAKPGGHLDNIRKEGIAGKKEIKRGKLGTRAMGIVAARDDRAKRSYMPI